MIFQDPMTSLNPVLTIGLQIREALGRHFGMGRRDARQPRHRAARPGRHPYAAARLGDYPHQFSGGMRQRAMIAMALACEPKLLIADEPTTALDVTIQAQILDLLRALVAEHGTALILITHDLGVVAGMCERVHVMYAGTFVETGDAPTDLRRPATSVHARPAPERPAPRRRAPTALQPIAGQPRNMLSAPASCPFAPRCRYDRALPRRAAAPARRSRRTGTRPPASTRSTGHEWQRTRLQGAA